MKCPECGSASLRYAGGGPPARVAGTNINTVLGLVAQAFGKKQEARDLFGRGAVQDFRRGLTGHDSAPHFECRACGHQWRGRTQNFFGGDEDADR